MSHSIYDTALHSTVSALRHSDFPSLQPKLKAKLEDSRYNIAMENHEFGVAPEAFTKWPILNDTYDIVSTSKDR